MPVTVSDQPIRQHLVPKVYLRSFCTEPVTREQIFAFDLASGKEFCTSIDRVAIRKHFYTLGLNTDSRSFAVEEAFSRLETDVRDILADIRSCELLPSSLSARSMLATFIGTQIMRTRQGLQVIHGHREEVSAGATTEARLPPAAVEDLLSLDDDRMRELFAKSAIVVGQRLQGPILQMQWNLIRAVEGYFVTSENPVFTFHRTESVWGIGTHGAQTFFPLSPKLFLLLETDPSLAKKPVHDMPAQGVRGLNGLTILSAEQYVYSHLSFANIQDLLAERATGGREFGPKRHTL
jgi:hypothetical protein